MNKLKNNTLKMLKPLISLIFMVGVFFIFLSGQVSAQNNDSLKTISTKDSTIVPVITKDSSSTNITTSPNLENSNPDAVVAPTVNPDNPDEWKDLGVAVSPASMHLSIKPGQTIVKEVKVNNDTKDIKKFSVGFNDYDMSVIGKPQATKDSKYGLSKWISASPTFFEMKPHSTQKIKLTISIPDQEESNIAAWTIMTIDQSVDRKPLDVKPGENTMAFGIMNTMGFGIWIYQNPPNVKTQNVEIQSFTFENNEGKRNLRMIVKNTGDGIGYSTSYVELTNLSTGKQIRLNEKRFTILPSFTRDFGYDITDDIPKGKYSAIGVIDFGSKELIQAAEVEFEIP